MSYNNQSPADGAGVPTAAEQLRCDSAWSVLVDLSGTLHVGDEAIPGSIEALLRLKESGVKVLFLSNTTKESANSLLQRLRRLGFQMLDDELVTALQFASQYVASHQLCPFLLLEDCARKEFRSASCNNPNAVVVGLAPSMLNYENMNSAFRLIMSGCPLIAIHKASYFRSQKGLTIGPGGFVAALEYATGCKSKVLGKPSASYFKMAMERVGCTSHRTFMVGDDVKDDISGAQELGIKGILVKTGKYRTDDEAKISPPPFAVCPDFSGAVDHILGTIKAHNNGFGN